MGSNIWRTLSRTAAAVCFVVSFGANAGGVFYQSDFDPLGFAGSAQWRVDDNCGIKSLADGYYGVNQFGNCTVALWSLSVSLWEGGAATLAEAIDTNDSTLITLPFANEESVANPSLVAGIRVIGGALAGVDTFLIGPKYFDNTGQCSSNIVCGTIDQSFGVQFTSGHDPVPGFLANFSFLPSSLLGGIPAALGNLDVAGAYLWEPGNYRFLNLIGACPKYAWTFLCEKEVNTETEEGNYARFTNLNADGTFRQIPEPGTLALMGAMLVAVWIARRHRREWHPKNRSE